MSHPEHVPSLRVKSIAILALAFCLLVFVKVAVAAPPGGTCNLPQDLQREIATKYRGAELVTLSDLDADDKGFFQKDHGDACPGLTKVDFYGDGKPTLALVLIAKTDAKGKAKLVVAHEVAGRWQTTVLDTADGAPVPVVWMQSPGRYRDVYGKKEVRATKPVIVFTGYESWSILYAWMGRRVAKIWLQD
jgi:hypothetical protein